MKIRCVIIEDQRPAQKILERYIEEAPQLELTGTFFSALEAADMVKSGNVDLLFLDIHLPKLSGLDFIKILPNPPLVILTTAFSEYALTGYDLNVVDYLLKPFDFTRFYQAVNKASELLNKTEPPKVEGTSRPSYYFAKLDRELIKIDFEDICYLEAAGDFVEVYFKDSKLLLSENLKKWEELLPEDEFVKVHKSYLVRIDKIDKVSGNVIHISGNTVPIGRLFRKEFLERLG